MPEIEIQTDPTTGNISIATNAQERLKLALNGGGPDPEIARQKAISKATERVTKDSRWTALRTMAQAAIDEANALADSAAVNERTYRQDAFKNWANTASQEHAESLLEKTAAFRQTLDAIKESHLAPAMPMPVTNVEMLQLRTRLELLDKASPEEASKLVQDAVQRGDRAFLTSAGVAVRSWGSYRNSWSNADAKKVADQVLSMIERATFTGDAAAAQHAADLADSYSSAWRYLVGELTKKGGPGATLDPVHARTGALAPLLEPDPHT